MPFIRWRKPAGVQEADRDGFHAFLGKDSRRRIDIVEVERLDLAAGVVEAPFDRQA
jgi:hypothetical protein